MNINRDYVLYLIAAILLVLMAFAAFYSPPGAWPLSITAIFCVFLANIHRFSEISASTSGVSATLHKAEERVANLKEMIEITSEIQLALLQQTGRMGGLSDDNKEVFLNKITNLMKEAGVSADKIVELRKRAWDEYVLFDYAMFVLGGNIMLDDPKKDAELHARWQALREFGSHGSSQDVENFLDEIGDHEPTRRRLLEAYRYYELNLTHMDAELWKKRWDVPRLTVNRKSE